ncbi:MAG: hypothetical protein SPF60_00445 [Lachnospiraceae bacterium]|nr:hypothetical protein [Oscillospiraceae bacterium]MDY5539886.1 hypothetical protein [Lachnospiraceae bacterium]MDY5649322.1 hypothetical protein [Lachnospiraceae bacterium]
MAFAAYNVSKDAGTEKRVKRVIGFILFWIAVGMLLMLLLPNILIRLIVMVIFLVLGYQLFCC